ncbi:MAG: long-chain fatty acid--CoA ligase [Thiotrichaceae bacterium]
MTWAEMATHVAQWQTALQRENLQAGDRVAIMARNSPHWIMFDQAALGLGLVTVPLYMDDRPDNVAYILNETTAKILVIDGDIQWRRLHPISHEFTSVQHIISLQPLESSDLLDQRLIILENWLDTIQKYHLVAQEAAPDALASIVYTSGTTGRPKGVMLSHSNILSNTLYGTVCADFAIEDNFLSFLPLSHMLERTAGYYLPMATGSCVIYSRSIQQLAMDLLEWKPTVLISVPRIYEQVYGKILTQLTKSSWLKRQLFAWTVHIGWEYLNYQQQRRHWHPMFLLHPLLQRLVASQVLDKMGGRLRIAICGGAALSPDVAKLFVGLGLALVQGYGLTETSPIITVNRLEDNIPSSIGIPLPNVEVKLGENDELLTRSACVTLGYWNNPEATAQVIDNDGWFHTGDVARQDKYGHWYLTGRIKDIVVLGTGEKVPPADMESHILSDRLFEQVLIVGEGRAYLSLLAVLNKESWQQLAQELGVATTELQHKSVQKALLARIGKQIKMFPGYAQVRRVTAILEPWTVENGLLTPTLKMKRSVILQHYASEINQMYQL